MAAHPSFPPAELESVCRGLADTARGLSGSEIGHLLAQLRIPDPAPDLNKWKRLSSALSPQQQRDGCGNRVLNLMKGMFGAFRNPTAHAPKISWNMTEPDALDLLTMASFCHRRLDRAARTPRTV